MLWLYLLGTVTILTIALRRVLRRQKPLDDELYAKNVAIEHVQSGVARVRADGTFGSVNPSFARTMNAAAGELIGQEWLKMFPAGEYDRVKDEYAQMLLTGVRSFSTYGSRPDGSAVWLNVRLVAVHDHHMRFVGHHCMIEDRTHEHDLERMLNEIVANKAELLTLELPLAATP